MERTKDTEPARLTPLDLNSRAGEKKKKMKALTGVRAAAEGRKTAAKKRAYMAAMESSLDGLSAARTDSLQLGMTLRWMARASGSYSFVHYCGVSSTTFYDLVNAGCNAIVETFPIVFDMSERSLKQRAKEFGQRQWKHMRVFYWYRGLS